MKNTVLILVAIFLSLTWLAYAQVGEMPAAPTLYLMQLNSAAPNNFLDSINKDKDIYNNCPISKAGDGAINVVYSWVDIPTEITYETIDSNIFFGLTVGLGRGIAFGATRGAAGLVDVATCAMPPYNKPLMEPEYAVKHPDKDGLKIALLQW